MNRISSISSGIYDRIWSNTSKINVWYRVRLLMDLEKLMKFKTR